MTTQAQNQEVIVFCQVLALALKSGRPLPESLGAIAGQHRDTRSSIWCRQIAEKMSSGYTAQEACADLADFDPVLARLIPLLGEYRLQKVLELYTLYLINLDTVKERLRAVMLYPQIVIGILVCNLCYLNVYLFPHVFDAMGTTPRALPIMVRLLHFTEISLWPLSLILPTFILVVFYLMLKTSLGRIDSNSLVTRFYGVATAVKLQEMARLQSLISLYLQAGFSLEKSVENSAQLAGNGDTYDLLSVSKVLSQGKTPEEAFAYSDLFMELAHADLTPDLYAEKLSYIAESNYQHSCARLKNYSKNMLVVALLLTGFFVALITSGVFDTYYWLIWMFS
ncbi:MAG: type II secretion system F family protein [Candidatus Riflebacteria bacterium]|nr:type II secretion system F family protein [Candidatus Riflebacteria bacterium]